MPRLFSKRTTYVKKKLTIRLSQDVAERLDRLLAEAEAAGNQATVDAKIRRRLLSDSKHLVPGASRRLHWRGIWSG